VNAENELINLLDQSAVEIVHLGEDQSKLSHAESAGVKSVPALVTPSGAVLHINYGASISDLKG